MTSRLMQIVLALALSPAAPVPATPVSAAPTPEELLAHVEGRLTALRDSSSRAEDVLERATLLLTIGEPERARDLVPALLERGVPGRALAARIHLGLAEFSEAAPLVDQLVQADLDERDARAVAYRWWVLVDDLPRVEAESAKRSEPVDLSARAELAALTLDFPRAESLYVNALSASRSPADSARAYQGLGVVANLQRDFETSLGNLSAAVFRSDPDPDLLRALADTFIRLGKTADAIEAARLAVRSAPFHEGAHYLLGNGYTARSYTDLFAAFPRTFADAEGRATLARVDTLLAAGNSEAAWKACADLAALHPGWADVRVRQGSLVFALGGFDAALRHFAEALSLCPEYGRAHNGMAKAVEAMRLQVEVHRPAYEQRFAALPMPRVPGIENFVLNWSSLTPRHQKQVALSVAPWQRYLPVLIASGATYYIKPLHELLSETPGQELLRDQRINYDSRLWDDVRGCGGYHTVTGMEDVERTILNRYNTVLHELTHQVHSVLTAERKRAVQELYRRTKERDEASQDAFLSRYAGGSVWEYFAEGANALESPRRDVYDTRDIVRERLDAKDTGLRDLVLEIMTKADVESCYAVGFTNRGDDRLERGRAGEAIAAYHEALARSPGDETALGALVFALEVADSTRMALSLAERESRANPACAALSIRHAYVLWETGQGLETAISALEKARERVREEERYLVDLELGRLRWVAGSPEASRRAFQEVLEYQADNPEGLWGLAEASALAGDWDAAFARFEEAVRLRTGVVELRAAYARELLRAGRRALAREQIDAALLLDPEDPEVLALEAWWLLEEGRGEEGRAKAGRALEIAPWCDLARIVLARIEMKRSDPAAARQSVAPVLRLIEKGTPPRYVYRSKWGRYDLVHMLPEVERRLIPVL